MTAWRPATPPDQLDAERPESTRALRALIPGGFALSGLVTSLLGPLLPVLSARWRLSDAQAGVLFLSLFGSSVLGVLLASRAIPRRGFVVPLVAGHGLMAAGIGVLAWASHVPGVAALAITGVGLGLVSTATNLWTARAYRERAAAALNLVNMLWAVGAIAGPVGAMLFARPAPLRFFLMSLAGCAALLLAALSWASKGLVVTPAPAVGDATSHLRHPLAPVFGLVLFIYVGTEVASGGWTASYVQRVGCMPGDTWALVPSGFWTALVAGRGLAALALRRVPEETLALAGLGTALLGMGTLLASTSLAGVVGGIALLGAGLGPIFPITVALLSRVFGEGAPRVTGLLFALGALGGAVVPWVVGVVSTRLGSLRAGLGVPILACLALAALYVRLRAARRDSH